MVKNSQKQSKDSQNSKHDHWCTNCHILPRLYQQCTNRQKQPKVSQNRKHDRPLVYQFSQVYQDSTNRLPTMYQKTVKRQLKQQKKHWCTNRHMSTQSPPNTQSYWQYCDWQYDATERERFCVLSTSCCRPSS